MKRFLPMMLLAACAPQSTPWTWKLPEGTPPPKVPDDNPMTAEKVALGRHLFYDVRLSGNGTTSCATCHPQERAFADGKPTPTGSTGDPVPRNAPGLANVAYLAPLTWGNPNQRTLEQQALGPMFGESPVELGLSADPDGALKRFRDDATYRDLFAAAFPSDPNPVRFDRMTQALASFERALISFDSPYDRFRAGEKGTLSESALRGHAFFNDEKGECYHCHFGPELTSAFATANTTAIVPDFHNTGLYDPYPAPNRGLFELTQKPEDMGFFRVPSLRNVALTAPYMHDGSVATLEEVLDLYAAGGRGAGVHSALKDPLIRAFPLTAQEKEDLLAFLKSLTDASLITDERWSDPWKAR